VILHYIIHHTQAGHQPGKAGKVGEFENGHGKYHKPGKATENMLLPMVCYEIDVNRDFEEGRLKMRQRQLLLLRPFNGLFPGQPG